MYTASPSVNHCAFSRLLMVGVLPQLPVKDVHDFVRQHVPDVRKVGRIVTARVATPHPRRQEIELRRPCCRNQPALRLE